jgi:hypothetical protein
LTVYYTVSGTAAGGSSGDVADYQQLTGSVTIPAGETCAPIDVQPFDRGLAGGSPTVVVTLPSGTGYSVLSTFSHAMVTIADDDALASPPSGYVGGQMTFYNPDGTVEGVGDGQGLAGNFLVMGIKATSGDTTGGEFTLDYDPTLITISWDREGSDVIVPDSTTISPTSSDTIVYVGAASGTALSSSDIGGGINLVYSGGTTSQALAQVEGPSAIVEGGMVVASGSAEFVTLRLKRDDVDITDDTGDPSKRDVLVGEMIDLSVV